MESLQKLRQAHNVGGGAAGPADDASQRGDGTQRSIYSAVTYNNSAVGEMITTELDVLLEKNEARINAIKEKFEFRKENIKSFHDVLVEQKEAFETKEHHKDNSLAYPTYGRGLQPTMAMNTFMIQEGMTGQVKRKFTNPDEANQLSPQVSV